ncbi:hypothetical protein [Nocardia miyunensis]|uniref:hypothetical protein n=1 Tax=Nocardia miyunensis TaxID=282684 RepID=UPI00082B052F|nr:hypothetical protein [Nocardia miyunensis]
MTAPLHWATIRYDITPTKDVCDCLIGRDHDAEDRDPRAELIERLAHANPAPAQHPQVFLVVTRTRPGVTKCTTEFVCTAQDAAFERQEHLVPRTPAGWCVDVELWATWPHNQSGDYQDALLIRHLSGTKPIEEGNA